MKTFLKRNNFLIELSNLHGVSTSFGQESRKTSLNVTEGEKKSLKFVYILAKQCRSRFNLTNFSKKNSKF